jgi:hypothetical protein
MMHYGIEIKVEKTNEMFDSTNEKYKHLFKTTILLTNFIHMCHQDFVLEIIGEHQNNLAKHGYDGEY